MKTVSYDPYLVQETLGHVNQAGILLIVLGCIALSWLVADTWSK